MATPELIGYWRSEIDYRSDGMTAQQQLRAEELRQQALRWPDARDFVNPCWDEDERVIIVDHLEKGTLVNQFRGLSPCRLCGRHNGSAELTDGTFCWPEGLAHYLLGHGVRLPDRFVAHALAASSDLRGLPRPSFDRLGMRDRSWPGPDFGDLLWKPLDDAGEHGIYLNPDPSWWVEQADRPL